MGSISRPFNEKKYKNWNYCWGPKKSLKKSHLHVKFPDLTIRKKKLADKGKGPVLRINHFFVPERAVPIHINRGEGMDELVADEVFDRVHPEELNHVPKCVGRSASI